VIVWTDIEDAIFDWVVAATGLPEEQVLHEKGQTQRPTEPYIGIQLAIEKKGQDWINTVDKPLTLAADDVDVVDFANDELDVTGHAYVTGDGPVRLTTTGTLPTGLALDTDYWVIVIGVDTIQLAATFQDAINPVPVPVSFSDAGSGTHTINGTASTARAGEEIQHTVRGTRLLTITLQAYGGDPTQDNRPAALLHNVMTKVILPSIADPLNAAGVSPAIFSQVQELDVTIGSDIDRRGLLTVTAHLAEEISEDGTYIEIAELENDPPFS